MVILYPGCLDSLAAGGTYIAQEGRLEFGARNLIDPRTIHRIEPYLATISLTSPIDFPVASGR